MLQKVFFPGFYSFGFVAYVTNSVLIFEQFLRKNFKLFLCKFYYLHHHYYNMPRKLTLYYLYSVTIFWLKLIFRGKGYRMRKFKKLNKLTFNFGRSHWTKYKYNRDLYFTKKLRRQKILCFTAFQENRHQIVNDILSVKPLNVYTKRGLRWKKQSIKRRFGKISQVVSLLH